MSSPDILSRVEPALSSTGDGPVINPPPDKAPPLSEFSKPSAPNEASPPLVEPPKVVEPKAVEPPPAPSDPKPVEPAADPKSKDGLDQRFSKMAAQRREAERVSAELAETAKKQSADLAAALEIIKTLTPKAPELAMPQREQFDNPEAYAKALVDYGAEATRRAEGVNAEKIAADAIARVKADEAQKAQEAEQKRIQSDWSAKVEKAKAKHEDFEEVAMRDDIQISMPMAHAIINADQIFDAPGIGPELQYHLGKHPEEAARIHAMTLKAADGSEYPNAPRQVYELSKIVAELTKPPPVSKAPAPIEPIGARAAATAPNPETETAEEYAVRRNAEEKARGRRLW